MKHFFLPILLIVPTLLTAQSKKEQIAILKLRVDSISNVLVNERINMTMMKESFETEIYVKKDSLENLGNRIQETEGIVNQLQNANQKLRSDIDYLKNNGVCTHKEFMKFVGFDYGIEEVGRIEFRGIAESGWYDNWELQIYYTNPELDFSPSFYIPGKIYLVSFSLGSDEAGYHKWDFENARKATIEEVNAINQDLFNFETIIRPNGDVYVGEIKDGKPHGQGTWTFANGSTHDGEWKDGKMHGLVIISGQLDFGLGIMEFHWEDGVPHGPCSTTFQNGLKWVGEFNYGRDLGNGIITRPDGSTYVGDYEDLEDYKDAIPPSEKRR